MHNFFSPLTIMMREENDILGRGEGMNKKTALITGAAKGIGKRTAYALAQAGFNMTINYCSSRHEAEQLANELQEKFGVSTIVVSGDITKPEDCRQIVARTEEQFGSVDVLIHNAGPFIKKRKKMEEYDDSEWQYIVNGNLNSAFYLSKLTLPGMRKKHWGRIITFGFDRVETAPGWIYRSAFAASKTGLASLTRTIALEEAENGITANMICPGDITGDWKEKEIHEAMGVKDDTVPVGRPGTGEDIARLVAFLCSEQSDFITGAIIPVTGGKDVLGKVFYE